MKDSITGYLVEFRQNIETAIAACCANPGNYYFVKIGLRIRKAKGSGELIVSPFHKISEYKSKAGKTIKLPAHLSQRLTSALPLESNEEPIEEVEDA